jgi:hypothetical protein
MHFALFIEKIALIEKIAPLFFGCPTGSLAQASDPTGHAVFFFFSFKKIKEREIDL